MMVSFLLICFKVFLVILILAGMVMVLLGIGNLVNRDYKEEEKQTAMLRREVEQGSSVISNHSLFRRFLSESKDAKEIRLKAAKKNGTDIF